LSRSTEAFLCLSGRLLIEVHPKERV
jgi:hypothetical protein